MYGAQKHTHKRHDKSDGGQQQSYKHSAVFTPYFELYSAGGREETGHSIPQPQHLITVLEDVMLIQEQWLSSGRWRELGDKIR